MTEVLLREPGDFEGFGLVVEVVEPSELALAECPHHAVAPLDAYTATGPNRPDTKQRHDPIPRVDQTLDLHFVALPSHSKVREPVGDSIHASIRIPGVWDVVIEELGISVDPLPDWLAGLAKALVRLPDDFHVLLRHRLLRQPGGFEGLGLFGEAIDSHDEAVSKGVESRKLALDLDSFPTPKAPEIDGENPAILSLDPLQRLRGRGLPAPDSDPDELFPSLMAEKFQVVIRTLDTGIDFDGRVQVPQGAIEVTIVKGLGEGPQDLHVLLRHRLLQQPGCFEGFLTVEEDALPHD